MNQTIWSKQEEDILVDNYADKGDSYVSGLVNRSTNAVRIKAFRMGFRRFDKNIELSPDEEQIILGSLLGDMYCRIRRKNAQIEEAHCRKQIPYLLRKLNQLKKLTFFLRETRIGALQFESRIYPFLNYYYELFYGNGKKQVNNRILDRLDAFGLAVWYMDDGSYNRRDNNCTIYTNGFSYDENVLIKTWFEKKWGIFPKIYPVIKRSKRYYTINFNVKETKKFIDIVGPYIHESMKYKIGLYDKKMLGGS